MSKDTHQHVLTVSLSETQWVEKLPEELVEQYIRAVLGILFAPNKHAEDKLYMETLCAVAYVFCDDDDNEIP